MASNKLKYIKLLFFCLQFLSCSTFKTFEDNYVKQPIEKYIVLNDNFYNQIQSKVFDSRTKRITEEIVFINTGIIDIESKYYKLNIDDSKYYSEFSENFYEQEIKTILNKEKYFTEKNIQAIYVFTIMKSGEQFSSDIITIVDTYNDCSDIFYRSILGWKSWQICSADFSYFVDEFSTNQHYSFNNKKRRSIDYKLVVDKITPISKFGDIKVESVISTQLLVHTKNIIDCMILNKEFDWDSFGSNF